MGPVVGNLCLSSPVLLAPMAGITDLPFRRLVAGFGAGLVVSEMVASGELLTARAATRARAEIDPALRPASVQIAGREAAPMAEAARICEGQGAEIIDINMGCPAKKVTGGFSGSALMRDPDHALRLIEAVTGAVRVPVTLKMRLGWDDGSRNAADLARRAEAAGVAMIAVHARTRCQFYRGAADWAAVRAVREAVSVPLVVNGDIVDAASARGALAASGADAVMIGRGAQGAPWVLSQIAAGLVGRRPPATPTGTALAGTIIAHYEAILGFYGRDLGRRVARKHLGWYLDRLEAAALRVRVLRMDDPAEVIHALRGLPELEEAA